MRSLTLTSAAIGALALAQSGQGGIYITEYSSNPSPEFIEITNTGDTAIDMTNWSYSDSDRQPFDVSFSGALLIGLIQPHESIIFTETSPASFRTLWNLPASVRVLGPNTNSNLSSSGDEINIFDADGNLVDRLTYTSGTAAVGNSRNILAANLGANQAGLSVTSVLGDTFGTFAATNGRLGNPGVYVPAPGAAASLSLVGLAAFRRRRA